MAKGQKSRKQKVSKGINRGARSVPLTQLQLILLGKGMAHVTPKKKSTSKRSRRPL